ncbi:MAG: aldo/keto reductase, partial [Bacteroidetes bacterium]|nr:aldo/keto reductase [Fibrella sp.]
MTTRQLGNTTERVSALGLGCMAMAAAYPYGPADEAESVATLNRALALGITFWDTADAYALGANEQLVSRVLVPNRKRVFIATKFGFVDNGQSGMRLDLRPERIQVACEDSLRRLGIDTIDLYYAHRVDPAIPVEEMVGEMSRLVESGKVRYLGLSEASASSLHRAYAVHPLAALQSEYSLFTREVEEEILPACRALGVSLVPYSPLGRGLLTNQRLNTEQLAPTDYRRSLPRYQPDTLTANQPLVNALTQLAAEKGCSTAELALAWLLAQDERIIPIPGTKRRAYLEANAGAVNLVLTQADLT